jgi:hypothetical protein
MDKPYGTTRGPRRSPSQTLCQPAPQSGGSDVQVALRGDTGISKSHVIRELLADAIRTVRKATPPVTVAPEGQIGRRMRDYVKVAEIFGE